MSLTLTKADCRAERSDDFSKDVSMIARVYVRSLLVIALVFTVLVPITGAQAPAPQSAATAESILQRATEQALQYTANLPNFICTQTVVRSAYDRDKQTWNVNDKLIMSLSYSDKGETYTLLSINDKPTKKSYKDVGGVTSDGEFATLLQWVFRPESQTKFEWKWPANLRGRETDVFSYRVEQEHSQYHASFNGKRYEGIFAWGGLVYVDRASGQVLRLTHAPDDFPPTWPVASIFSDLDYDFVTIAGNQFLVPLRAGMRLIERTGGQTRNEIQFHDYRKFSAEATIRAVQ